MEQKSSETKMAVAGGTDVQLNECFVKLGFNLKSHWVLKLKVEICGLVLGSIWKVSYQHLMAF